MENPFGKRKHDSRDLVLKLSVRPTGYAKGKGLLPHPKIKFGIFPRLLVKMTEADNRPFD